MALETCNGFSTQIAMTSPIPLGTLLRQRYSIQQVLGQGGFSRTYLALDLERFNEPCVLKELAVPQQDKALFDKAKALFQREASVLYQMQHLQIPRFWAAFEDQGRLFSVQEFVDGQTYRTLLQERKKQGSKFSEAEILHFLNHLLPVLTYIHDRNIIHRDISPENIMLRMRQNQVNDEESASTVGLPVLIDFGAVKAVADYLSSAVSSSAPHSWSSSEITRVGKAGYAPPEQLQTGRVYPHSDLYALAATSLVLLTGKEPRALLDSHTLTWRVQVYANVSDRLATILQKMLALRPHERYQSAAEVQADLQALLPAPVPPTVLNPDPEVIAASAPVITVSPGDRSDINARQAGDRGASAMPRSPSRILGAARRNRAYLLGAFAGISVAVFLGVVLPLVWRLTLGAPQSRNEVWISGAKLPQSEASQIIGSNRPESQNPINNNDQPETIQFAPGAISTVLEGNLDNQVLKLYSLRAFEGQIMTVVLEGAGVTMNLLNSARQGIDTAAYQTRSWTGQLPKADDYVIQVVGSGAYRLEVAITPLQQATQAQPITLAPKAVGTTLRGNTAPAQPQRYRFTAKRGQVLTTQILQGTVQVTLISPLGQRIEAQTGQQLKSWQSKLPADGSYILEVSSSKPEKFVLSLQIR